MSDELTEIAARIAGKLEELWPGDIRPMQVLALAEEAGEAVGAARRHLGMARRTSTKHEVATELADVVITTFVLANLLDIDLPTEIEDKVKLIFGRPWRDEMPDDLPDEAPNLARAVARRREAFTRCPERDEHNPNGPLQCVLAAGHGSMRVAGGIDILHAFGDPEDLPQLVEVSLCEHDSHGHADPG
jgi:NTP pyrophosphatase (non-canonical NTP hydrolase)